MRVFVTQAQYDTYRNSLGDANVFPASSSLFMSFDKDILALYTRGNDTGGRCIGTQISATFSGDTLAATAAWQPGTCGAPSTAHYPFILVALSRTATDGKNEQEKCEGTKRIKCINEGKSDISDEQTADSRADDGSDLKHTVIPRHRVRGSILPVMVEDPGWRRRENRDRPTDRSYRKPALVRLLRLGR